MDADGDGDPDIYVVNDFGSRLTPNTLLFNDGTGHFQESPPNGSQVAACGMGLGIGDINEDGLPDFLVTSVDRLYLLESVEGFGWVDTALARGLTVPEGHDRHVAWGAQLEDFNNDGLLDAYVAYGHLRTEEEEEFEEYFGTANPLNQKDALFLQNPDGSFSQVAEQWGIANPGRNHGVATGDLNRDGWLDLATRDRGGPFVLHLSRCGKEHWLQISLSGERPNASAIGARVEVEAGGYTQRRWIFAGGTGVGSSGPPVAHFGLGETETVDAIRVFWPDGVVSELGSARSNQMLRIHYPE